MLASQMASVSQVTKSAVLLQATVAPSTAIARSTRLPRRCRHQQQVRNFRIGFWSSYLDPAFQKEFQRRHRVIKHKYAEALNRKLSWDRRLPACATRWGLKGLMCSSWNTHDPRPGGRWVNVDEVREVKDDPKITVSRGIEEVEQDAVDELFGRKTGSRSFYSDRSFGWNWAAEDPTPVYPVKTRYRNVREPGTNREPVFRQNRHQSGKAETSSNDQEYVIDPITNRKVFKKGQPQPETRLRNSDSSATEIPVKTFKGYRSQFSHFEPPVEHVENTVIHLDGDGVSGSSHTVQENIQDEADKYKPFKYNEPDGKSPDRGDTVTDKLRDHDHLYTPFRYNEPDGKFPEKPDCVSKSLSDFDHQYKPFRYNEPDGKFPEQSDPVTEGLKDYDHQIGHKPQHRTTSSSAEIDGKQCNTTNVSAQGSWLSQTLKVGQGRWGPIVAQPREQNQGKTIEPSLDRSSQSQLSDLDPVATDKREDLDLLRASDIRAASGILRTSTKESQTEKNQRRAALETDFDQIQVRASSLAEEIATTKKVKEKRQVAQDLELERSYLLNHNAHARGRVNAKIAELDAEMAEEMVHLDAPNSVTGNFVRDFPEEFSASWTTKGSSTNSCLVPKIDTDAWGYDKSPKGLELSYQDEVENEIQCAENDYVTDSTSDDRPGSRRMETALHRNLKIAENKAEISQDGYTKEPKGLETSYAEEVQEQGNCESPLFVKSYGCEKKAQHDKELVRDIRNIYESTYGTIDCKHRQILENQEILETLKQEDNNNRMQRNIQSLEDLVRESQYQVHERYMDVAKVLAKQTPLEEQVASASDESSFASNVSPAVAPSPEPTIYKILAYDPIMQTIKMAETTSIVTDTSSALTPAEVLLRLSNPAKFFPHFQPLQSQGYEIASGSGDVLVFRKVREGAPITASSVTLSRKDINPIDGMQSAPQPATGNFASPTGFVNHDLPSDHPFISGIDVRREEPVFSGRRTEWQDGDADKGEPRRRSKRVGRGLLIGAAWVAACSYAVGVVAEFFKTGGSDGKGPVGF